LPLVAGYKANVIDEPDAMYSHIPEVTYADELRVVEQVENW
jgi:hypothetical protein